MHIAPLLLHTGVASLEDHEPPYEEFYRVPEKTARLIITPDRPLGAVDALLTGFHEPRATHLAMLHALAGPDHIHHAYSTALHERYLWHEFGDLHLILP